MMNDFRNILDEKTFGRNLYHLVKQETKTVTPNPQIKSFCNDPKKIEFIDQAQPVFLKTSQLLTDDVIKYVPEIRQVLPVRPLKMPEPKLYKSGNKVQTFIQKHLK